MQQKTVSTIRKCLIQQEEKKKTPASLFTKKEANIIRPLGAVNKSLGQTQNDNIKVDSIEKMQ